APAQRHAAAAADIPLARALCLRSPACLEAVSLELDDEPCRLRDLAPLDALRRSWSVDKEGWQQVEVEAKLTESQRQLKRDRGARHLSLGGVPIARHISFEEKPDHCLRCLRHVPGASFVSGAAAAARLEQPG